MDPFLKRTEAFPPPLGRDVAPSAKATLARRRRGRVHATPTTKDEGGRITDAEEGMGRMNRRLPASQQKVGGH